MAVLSRQRMRTCGNDWIVAGKYGGKKARSEESRRVLSRNVINARQAAIFLDLTSGRAA
jgi:hypothetical protein